MGSKAIVTLVANQVIVLPSVALGRARMEVLLVQEANRKEVRALEVVALSFRARATVVADGATGAETAHTKVVVAKTHFLAARA